MAKSISVFARILDRPIAFHRVYVSITGDVVAAVLLSQAVYWSERTDSDDGYFWKTAEQWEEETGLTRREQESSRGILRELGILEEDKRGVPMRIYYKVNLERIVEEIERLDEDQTKRRLRTSRGQNRTESGKFASASPSCTVCGKIGCTVCGKIACTTTVQDNNKESEITSENTAESTPPGNQKKTATATATATAVVVQNEPLQLGNGTSLKGRKERYSHHVTEAKEFGVDKKEFIAMTDLVLDWSCKTLIANEDDQVLNEAKQLVLDLIKMNCTKFADEQSLRKMKDSFAINKDKTFPPNANPSFRMMKTFAELYVTNRVVNENAKRPGVDHAAVELTNRQISESLSTRGSNLPIGYVSAADKEKDVWG